MRRRQGCLRSQGLSLETDSKKARDNQRRSDITDRFEQARADVSVLGDLVIEPAVAETEPAAQKQHLNDDLSHWIERDGREHHQAEIAEALSVAVEIALHGAAGHNPYRDDQSGAAER